MLYIKASGPSEAYPLENSKGKMTDRVLFAGFDNKFVNYIAIIKVSNNWFLRMCSRIIHIFTHSLVKVENPAVLGGHQWVLVNDNSLKKRLNSNSIQELIKTPVAKRCFQDLSLNRSFPLEGPLFQNVANLPEEYNVLKTICRSVIPSIGVDSRINLLALKTLTEQTANETATRGIKLLSTAHLCRDILVVDGKRYLLLKEKDDRSLGFGAFKKIYYAIDLETGKKWAISIFSNFIEEGYSIIKRPCHYIKLARQEANLMKEFYQGAANKAGGSFVMGSPGHVETVKGEIITLMEYCDRGDLFDLIINNNLPPEDRQRLAEEILMGALEIEKHGYIHRDLKPENIFLKTGEDGRLHAVIGDFGFTSKKGETGIICGTPQFAPLDLLLTAKNEECDLIKEEFDKIDVWALGLVLYPMFHPRYRECVTLEDIKSYEGAWQRIIKGDLTEKEKSERIEELWKTIKGNIEHALTDLKKADVNPHIIEAIEGLLQVDFTKRMSIEEALKLVKQAP